MAERYSWYSKSKTQLSVGAMVILFCALVRCIAQALYIGYSHTDGYSWEEVAPFMWGAGVTSVALFAITMLFWKNFHAAILILGAVTIGCLVWLKLYFGI